MAIAALTYITRTKTKITVAKLIVKDPQESSKDGGEIISLKKKKNQ